MISFDLNGTDVRVAASLHTRSNNIVAALAERMTSLMSQLQERIQDNYLSGQVLNVQSGQLREGVKVYPTQVEGEEITGRVISETWYGRIQTEGGTRTYAINPIYTRSESRRIGRGTLQPYKVLHFEIGGREIFARYAFRPPLKSRPFMQPALESMKSEIIEGLKDAVLRAVIE